jgi:hypothetical protein
MSPSSGHKATTLPLRLPFSILLDINILFVSLSDSFTS